MTQSMRLLEQVHDSHQRSLAMAEPSNARVMLSGDAALNDGTTLLCAGDGVAVAGSLAAAIIPVLDQH